MQRLLPPLLLLLTLMIMIIVTLAWPGGKIIPLPMRWIGGGVAAIGICIAVKGARTFKQVGTNIKTFDKPQKLVTKGLYAWSRNPMYLGFALCSIGFGTALGSMPALLIAALFCVTLDRWYVQFEEAIMRDTFGAEYEAYRARVRRWL